MNPKTHFRVHGSAAILSENQGGDPIINGHQTEELTVEDDGPSLAETFLLGYRGPLALTDQATGDLFMVSDRTVRDLIADKSLASVKIKTSRRITIWSTVDYLLKLEQEQAI